MRIWQLCSGYGGNDFINNLMYTLTFPNFIVSDYGSEVVWRDDGGKVLHRAGSRVEQTQNANALWWWYGPHDERTKKSVDSINRLHAYWAGKYPGVFSHNVDYVYVFAYTAVAMHRLRLQMGAPGISEKEQIAAHKFWGEMSKLFVAENNVPIHGYPDDFAGLVKLCEDYENTPRPKPERTNLVTTAIHEQFVFRFFPEELHWLGHQLGAELDAADDARGGVDRCTVSTGKGSPAEIHGFDILVSREYAGRSATQLYRRAGSDERPGPREPESHD
ncbi:hypothetical protein [Massilia phosphatilytica]